MWQWYQRLDRRKSFFSSSGPTIYSLEYTYLFVTKKKSVLAANSFFLLTLEYISQAALWQEKNYRCGKAALEGLERVFEALKPAIKLKFNCCMRTQARITPLE